MHAALDDDLLLHLGCFARKLQRVAADIGDAVEDFRRLIVVCEDDRVALLLQVVDRLHIGRHERPFDLGNNVLHLGVEMRGGALDLRRPFQRRHGECVGAFRSGDAPAHKSFCGASGTPQIVGTVNCGDGHFSLLKSLYILNMSIYRF